MISSFSKSLPAFDAITLVYFNSSDRCIALPHGAFSIVRFCSNKKNFLFKKEKLP